MKKQIISNLTSNYALSFVGMTLGFFLVPFLIGKLGKGLYGIIVLTESTIAFFEILTVSVRQAMSRHATFAYSQNKMSEFIEYLSTSLRILYMSAATIACLGTLVAFYFPVIFKVPTGYGVESQWHFFMISSAFALSALNIPYWSALYAKQRFDLINLSSSCGLILRAVCVFAFYSLAPQEQRSLTAYGFIFLAMTLGQNSLIYFWYHKLFPGVKLRLTLYNPKKVREILSFSAHTSLTRVSGLLYQNASNILINVFWGPSMNTMYSVALKLPNILHRIFIEPTWTLTPTFTDLAAKKDTAKTEKLLFAFSKMLALITHPILWTLIFLAPPIIRLWVGPDFSMAADLLRLYLVSLFTSIPISVFGSVINAHAKVKLPSYMNLGTAVVNLMLCLLLGVVFDLKLFGIAIASLVTGVSMSVLFYPVYACRVVGLSARKFFVESLIKPFVLSMILIGGSFAAAAVLFGWTLRPALFLWIGFSYILYFFTAYRWLLTDFERKYLRETVSMASELLNKPLGKNPARSESGL